LINFRGYLNVIIIIDGYNVLKQVGKGETISEQQRRSFIKQLAAYQKIRSHKKIIVVFDAGPSTWPSQEKVHGISVVYSGTERTADDYINSFLQEQKEKAHNMILVSSDRQLCEWASDYEVASIDAHEFYDLVQQAIRPPKIFKETGQKAVKIAQDSTPELDELMRQASTKVQAKKEDMYTADSESKNSDKLSKKDRALLRKLKKL